MKCPNCGYDLEKEISELNARATKARLEAESKWLTIGAIVVLIILTVLSFLFKPPFTLF